MGSEPTDVPDTDLSEPEQRVEAETEQQAEEGDHDEVTAREAVELGLMAEDESDEGEDLGEHID
ncbi:MAG TPA: hypothetical protein VD926_00395 [Acidimicrobiales bacterium]|nr:hypothetical protein [Acidimicrobiales bacterium]